ncbi:hypothetical protein ACO2RV_04685 [Ancylobacter sp. VNQ12]|uniref:hypothetical protein n=1 Tax=Ancylobacter sp. VNQ12 TaxID=3400920 RepID=UPI003C049555
MSREPSPEEQRANDMAAQIALAAITRILIGEIAMHPDPAEFHARLRRLDDAVTGDLLGRHIWPDGDAVAETYVKEAATRWASSLIAGIRHPKDQARDREA